MITFLFWNIGGRSLETLISTLVRAHDVDILMLAECRIPLALLMETLNSGDPAYQFPLSVCEHITLLTRFHARFVRPKFESKRISIRRVALPARQEILLVMAHLPSKSYFSEADQE